MVKRLRLAAGIRAAGIRRCVRWRDVSNAVEHCPERHQQKHGPQHHSLASLKFVKFDAYWKILTKIIYKSGK